MKDNKLLTQTFTTMEGDGKYFKETIATHPMKVKIGEDDLGELIRSLEDRIEKLEKAENER